MTEIRPCRVQGLGTGKSEFTGKKGGVLWSQQHCFHCLDDQAKQIPSQSLCQHRQEEVLKINQWVL